MLIHEIEQAFLAFMLDDRPVGAKQGYLCESVDKSRKDNAFEFLEPPEEHKWLEIDEDYILRGRVVWPAPKNKQNYHCLICGGKVFTPGYWARHSTNIHPDAHLLFG